MAKKQLDVLEVSEALKTLGSKDKWTPEEAAIVVKAAAKHRRRGATLAAFARGMGVKSQRIRNWRDGRNSGGQHGVTRGPALVPMTVVGSSSSLAAKDELDSSWMEIGLVGGRSVRVGTGFDVAAVARLVKTLEQLGC